MTEKKFWSMDELVALTDEVTINEIVFRGRLMEFQYCELTEWVFIKRLALNEYLK